MRVNIRIAHDGVQPCILEHFNILRLFAFVRNVINRLRLFAFLCLFFADLFAEIAVYGHIFARKVFENDDIAYFRVKIVVLNAAEFYERRNIGPARVEFFSVVAEERDKLVRNLFGNVFGNFLHLLIVLQERARNVKRNVGAVDHAVQELQKFGDHLFDIVGDKDLIAIKFYLSAFELHLFLLWGNRGYLSSGKDIPC